MTIIEGANGLFDIIKGPSMGISKGEREVIAFMASWCGPCRIMVSDFRARGAEVRAALEGAKARLLYVDIDEQVELARDYEVQSVPALVAVSESGERLGESIGRVSVEEFNQFLSEHYK